MRLPLAFIQQNHGTQPILGDANQNLFYLNNVIHDALYQQGFDEAAGNFQNDNFGNGGRGGDAVLAEAQDGSGTDNANFSTPRDGRSGRMQMYLWHGDGASFQVAVNSPAGSGPYDAGDAEFGPSLDTAGVSGDLVLVEACGGFASLRCLSARATAANLKPFCSTVQSMSPCRRTPTRHYSETARWTVTSSTTNTVTA